MSVDRYAVFGNPIAQSKSPDIHAAFARQTGQALEYTRQLVDEGGFREAADAFFNGGGKGLNVTVPFKHDAFDYAEELSERARAAGAVNTLIATDAGVIRGDNTDGVGLIQDITRRLGWSLAGKRVLVIGAGGAVRGVLLPLLDQQPAQVVIANRTASKARDLADVFAGHGDIRGCGYDELAGQAAFDVLINGTSAGLSGEVPPIPGQAVAAGACAYDMVYGDQPTAFMRWAEQQGAGHTADGLGMLVGQAAESFYLWRGVRPDMAPVIQQLR